MADRSWGSDDMLAAAEEDRIDAAQERYHSGHYGLAYENVAVCRDCASDVLNYPEEYLPGFSDADSPIFWEMFNQPAHEHLDPSEFDFIYQPQLKELGLV